MTGIRNSWQAELIARHPRLFDAPGHSAPTRQHPTCGEGWHDLLQRCCARIEEALVDGGEFIVDEIKSKYGTLRFEWIGNLPPATARKIDDAIDLAEARSACTCEVCGREGRLYSNGGWLTTFCTTHASGWPVTIDPDLENLHLTHAFDDGRTVVVSCRRYIRATDSFVDVDPALYGIEE